MIREMRRLLCLVTLALLGSCGGGGGDQAPPTTLSGTWNATSLVVGSALTIVLTEQNTQVAGVGTYRVEAGASGVLTIAGVHSGIAVTLEFVYDNGDKATYAAVLQDANHMNGQLVFQGGNASTVQFVRQSQ
jgi:hypothetical protein